MSSFVCHIPTKVYFGENQLCHLGEELKNFGNRVLLIYGGGSIKKNGIYEKIINEIKKDNLEVFELYGVLPNPRIDLVREGVNICKEKNIDVLLAVGGGSVIDTAKYISAGACVEHDPWDFLSKNAPVEKVLPLVTILTISAAGSEMDNSAVLSDVNTRDKIGKKHQLFYPKVSFLDPTFTYSVDEYQTACGSADIFCHILETYFTLEDNFEMLDSVMEGMMRNVIKYAPIAMKQPTNYEARANLMWLSTWAINGFIKGYKTHSWSCHNMEHQLSGYYDITHGLGLAILTPRWLTYCLSEKTISRYVKFGVNVFKIDSNLPEMIIANKVIELLSNFFFNTLKLEDTFTKIGINKEHFEEMAIKSVKGSVLNSFIPLRKEDALKIFEMCL